MLSTVEYRVHKCMMCVLGSAKGCNVARRLDDGYIDMIKVLPDAYERFEEMR